MTVDTNFLDSVKSKEAHHFEMLGTSFHEAGHTIYALLHFIIVWSVKIYTDKETQRVDGFTHHMSLQIDKIQDPIVRAQYIQAELGMCYAGMVAEKYQYQLHSGSDKAPHFLRDGSSLDIKMASDLIKKYQLAPAGKKRYNYKQKILRKVAHQLQPYWADVTLVAHGLFRKKRLNAEALQKLLTKKSDNKEFWKQHFRDLADFYDRLSVTQ
jgi:hypothetical protein